MPPIKRRGLLKIVLSSPLLLLLSACSRGIGRFFDSKATPTSVARFGDPIPLPGTLDDYPIGSVTVERRGKFYLAHVPEGLLALYWKCTHLGCTVPFKANEEFQGNYGVFRCPCHGSIYLPNGVNVAGPTRRPLDLMEVQLSGNRIIVDTGKIRQRTGWDPSDAVKP